MYKSKRNCLLVAACVMALANFSLLTRDAVWGAEPAYCLGIAIESSGAAYLADRNLPGIWKFVDGKTSAYFTGSKKFRTPLNAVRCVTIDPDGKLLAGDSATRDIYRFDDAGAPQPLTAGGIGIPMSIASAADGTLYVADLELHRVWRVAKEGGKPELFVEVPAPRALCLDDKQQLWVVSHSDKQLRRYDMAAKETVVVEGRPFSFPSAVIVDAAGAALVCDTYEKAIWRVVPGDKTEKWFTGDPLVSPVGMAMHNDVLWVADPRAKGVVQIAADKTAKVLPFEVATSEADEKK